MKWLIAGFSNKIFELKLRLLDAYIEKADSFMVELAWNLKRWQDA